jgi:hypothetical protein
MFGFVFPCFPHTQTSPIGGRMDGETPSGQSRGGSPAWCACQIHNLLLMLPHITRYMLQIRLTDLNWRHLAQTSWHLCFFSSSYISIPDVDMPCSVDFGCMRSCCLSSRPFFCGNPCFTYWFSMCTVDKCCRDCLRGHPDFFQRHHSFARAFSAGKNPGASTFPAIVYYYYNKMLYI